MGVITPKDLIKVDLNIEKCEKVEQKILDILNSSDLNLKEVLFIMAHLHIDFGSTLEGIDQKLYVEEMWKRYAEEPTLGNALMAQGADILSEWLQIKDWEE